jgi:hypothetical protein
MLWQALWEGNHQKGGKECLQQCFGVLVGGQIGWRTQKGRTGGVVAVRRRGCQIWRCSDQRFVICEEGEKTTFKGETEMANGEVGSK